MRRSSEEHEKEVEVEDLQDVLEFIRGCGSLCLHLFECLSARIPLSLISF